jgi:hypothetical protein
MQQDAARFAAMEVAAGFGEDEDAERLVQLQAENAELRHKAVNLALEIAALTESGTY